MKQQGPVFKTMWPAPPAKSPTNGLLWRALHRATGIKGRDGHMERETGFGHMSLREAPRKICKVLNNECLHVLFFLSLSFLAVSKYKTVHLVGGH